MTSPRKIAANRANSRSSTGPKSRKGKSRSAQNARRHGLSLPVSLSPSLSKEVEELAQEIASGSDDRDVLEFARLFADAQIDLERITRVRYEYLQRFQKQFDLLAEACDPKPSEMDTGVEPPGSERTAPTQRYFLEQLLKIDRYEQRAVSRRKYAARMLNIALKAAKRWRDMSSQ